MTDETPRVNRSFFGGSADRGEAAPAKDLPPTQFGQTSAVSKHAELVRDLMKKSARPTDKCGELVRVDHKINDERYRGQHEH